MGFYNFFDIGKPQSKSFYIVQITRRYSVKALKTQLLLFRSNSYAIVYHTDNYFISLIASVYTNLRSFYTIFDSIVKQIRNHIRNMHLIR